MKKAEGQARTHREPRPLRQSAPPATKVPVPKIAETLSDLDAAAQALEQAERGSRQATLDFLGRCMAVRRNADRNQAKRAILEKELAKRGLRARSSDRSEFTRIVKYAEQRCSLSSARRSIYVAVLEHAYAHAVEAAAVPDFITSEGGVKECVAAYRASRRGNGGVVRGDAVAHAEEASKGKRSVRVTAIPRGETARFVALLLKRDPKRDGYWMAVGHKPAGERMIRALLPKPPRR
jgi:hypothetical protein